MLSVPGDEDAITVDFVPGTHHVQPVSRLGRPSIAHATSAGKVMLAFWGKELPDGPLRAYTPRTITDPRTLASEIAQVRERGLSADEVTVQPLERLVTIGTGAAHGGGPPSKLRMLPTAIVAPVSPAHARFGHNQRSFATVCRQGGVPQQGLRWLAGWKVFRFLGAISDVGGCHG